MRAYVDIKGISTVMKNLKDSLTDITKVSEVGMMQVATMIKASMDTQSPTIPVDLQNLDKSWFVVTTNQVRKGNMAFTGKYQNTLYRVHQKEINLAQAHAKRAKKGATLIMGFSTPYAIYIHEAPASYNWTRPGSGPKFFQAALERNQQAMINILQRSIAMNYFKS